MEENKNKTIADLIDLLTKHLEDLGYSQKTILRYHAVWKNYIPYCSRHNITEPSVESVTAFVSEQYGAMLGDVGHLHNVSRAVNLLLDYHRFGTVFKQSHMTLKGFSDAYNDLFEGFLDRLSKDGYSKGSLRTWRSRLFRFEHFLLSRDIGSFRKVELQHINIYIETLASYSAGTVGATINTLGKLSDYALANGYHDVSFSNALPKIRRRHNYRLPSVFTDEEIRKILDSIDNSNPLGKRMYAMILMAATYGLRIGDIRKLKFASLDWKEKKISLTTQKTGYPLELLLRDDVGWAIIDYLKHGRPETESEYVFVRHCAPFGMLTSSFGREVAEAVRRAGIKVPADKRIGMHAFRHSLATSLIKKGTDIHSVAHIISHADIHTTEHYISMDTEQLRQCAMEV